MQLLRGFTLVLLLMVGPSAVAVELGIPDALFSVEVHGFVSQGFILTTSNNYLAQSKEGSFDFTEVGLNFSKPLTEKLRTGFQLFSRKLGSDGNYSVKFDWFYLDYRLKDWFGIRAGRVKLPFGLYNDTSDIDSARAPVLLPQSVYPTLNRDFLLAQTGVELYGYFKMRAAGALEYRVYAGTIFLDTALQQPGVPYEIASLTTRYVVGGRLLWETPLEGLRLAGSAQALRLDATLLYPASMLVPVSTSVNIEIPAVLTVGSIEYTGHNLLLAAEYSRWFVDSKSSNPMLFPASSTVSERAYLMANYRVKPWFQPSVYYSLFFPNVDKRSGRANVQHDLAGTLRFDINAYLLIKLEGHYMHGTAALDPTLNGNQSLAVLAPDWAVFLIKATAQF